MKQKINPIDAYIATAPPKARRMLRQMRKVIKTVAPKATEKISYGMPYYSYHGRLAYFAAFRDHVSFFVMGAARKKYAKEIEPYQHGKATLRFPLDTKIPLRLITKLVKVQAQENERARP